MTLNIHQLMVSDYNIARCGRNELALLLLLIQLEQRNT
jgi:hypothetical protein